MNGPAIKFPDIAPLKEAMTQLITGDMEKLPGDQRILICDRERLDPAQNITPNVGAPYDFPIGISLPSGAPVPLESLLKKLNSVLRNAHHAGFDWISEAALTDISAKLLGLAQLSATKAKQIPQCLDFVLETLSPASLLQVVAIAHKAPDKSVHKFGDFAYGPVDYGFISRLSMHAGSIDYHMNSKSKLVGNVGVSRLTKELNVIDASSTFFRGRLNKGTDLQKTLMYRILDDYFHKLAEAMWKDFFRKLDIEQARIATAGGGYVPSSFFKSLERLTHRVSIFHRDQQGHGWVAPATTCIDSVITTAESLGNVYREFETGLRFDEWGKHPLDSALQRFCEYMYTVREYEDSERLEESFLHGVFALDLLIGGRSSEPLSVIFKQRIACLGQHVLNADYEEVQRFANECYAYRSSYAHRGQRIKMADQESEFHKLQERHRRLMELARIVFACACWCRRQDWCASRESWLARMDVLRAQLNAGVDSMRQANELGLNRIRQKSHKSSASFVIDWKSNFTEE